MNEIEIKTIGELRNFIAQFTDETQLAFPVYVTVEMRDNRTPKIIIE